MKDASPEWGFTGAKFICSKNPDPSIKYVVRKIRNSLGHGNMTIEVPHDLDYRKDEFEFEKRSLIKFYDKDKRDGTDIFEIEMPIDGLFTLVKKFQGFVYPQILEDMKKV